MSEDTDKLLEALAWIVSAPTDRWIGDEVHDGKSVREIADEALPFARQLIEDLEKLRESRDAFADDNLKLQEENERLKEGQARAMERAEVEVSRLQSRLSAAEDFRAEMVIDAFTAPDTDWNTILDSLRSRIADLNEKLQRAEAVVEVARQKKCHADGTPCYKGEFYTGSDDDFRGQGA